MAYTPPAVQLYQEFEAPAVGQAVQLSAVIIGPRYDFYEYPADKGLLALGAYDSTQKVTYSYPQLAATAVVDTATAQLYFDNVYLRYFQKLIADTSYHFRAVYPYRSRIRAAANIDASEPIFKTTTNRLGTTFTRSAGFLRDVRVGDAILVSGNTGGLDYSVSSLVAELIHDPIAPVVGSATADSANEGAHGGSVGAAGASVGNTGDDTGVSGGTYSGDLAAGVVADTYTVEVVTGGNYATQTITADNGLGDDTMAIDATSTWDHESDEVYTITVIFGGATGVAKIRYTSASGLDSGPIAGATVAFSTPITIGSYGLKVSFSAADTTLALGSSWEVTCTAGTAVLQVTSTSGTDDVLAYKARTDTFPMLVGTKGVTLALTDGGDTVLTLGDTWTIVVDAVFVVPLPTIAGTYTGTQDLTYRMEVTKGGLFGTCEITVTSTGVDSSGPTAITAAVVAILGTKGLTVTFPTNTQGGLLVGDVWTITVVASALGPVKTIRLQHDLPVALLNAASTVSDAVDVAPGGDDLTVSTKAYTDTLHVLSERDTEVYVVSITKAGAAGVAEYSVVSQSGLDSTPTAAIISAFGATEFSVGTLGVKVQFVDTDTDTDMDLGQSWAITVSKQNLNTSLYILQTDVAVPLLRADVPTDDAWAAKSTGVDVEQNIYLTDSTWVSGSTLVPLPVTQATQYIEYRALRTENTTAPGAISGDATDAEVEALVGEIHYKNPLAYACKKALLNSSNRGLYYMAVGSDDATGHSTALSYLKEYRDKYCLVPLSQNTAVHQLYMSHVNSMSTATENRWRVALLNMALNTSAYVYTLYTDPNSGASLDYMGHVENDPLAATTTYNLFIASSSQGIDFLTQNVAVGDVLEWGFHRDADGNEVWTEYTITEVRSQTALTFTPALTAAVVTPAKFRLKRSFTRQQQAENIKAYAESINNRRIMLVWPHQVGDGVNQVPGYHLAAAIAGMTAGNPPHQGFTNATVLGFTDVSYSFTYFTRDQLNTIADGGVNIVTQNVIGGVPFIRHQLMTNRTTLFDQEYSLVRNPDYISYYFYANCQDFIGRWNLYAGAIEHVRARMGAIISALKAEDYDRLGPILIDGNIISISQNETYRDRMDVVIEAIVASPINQLVLTVQFTL